MTNSIINIMTSLILPMMQAPFLRGAHPQRKLSTWHMMLSEGGGDLKMVRKCDNGGGDDDQTENSEEGWP